MKGVSEYLKKIFEETRKYYPDWIYVKIGMEADHIHLHMIIPPKYAVSTVVETIKKNTSRELRRKFRFIRDTYREDIGIWSPGYFVATVGMDEKMIKRYVEMQGKEDSGQTKFVL